MAAAAFGGLKNRAVAAAELVLAGRENREAGVVGAASKGGVLVVEHEGVGYGFSGEFPTFEHQMMKLYHYSALGYAFSQHEEQDTYHVP